MGATTEEEKLAVHARISRFELELVARNRDVILIDLTSELVARNMMKSSFDLLSTQGESILSKRLYADNS